MLPTGGMLNLLYNKPLLRLLEFVLFLTYGAAGYIYLNQSAGKLGTQGLLDALAIYSFIIAAYLLILVAEVADSHYLRALGALATLVGAVIGFYFIFLLDAPHLEAAPMGWALVSFVIGIAVTLGLLLTVVGRLVHGRLRSARLAQVRDERGPAPSRPAAEAMAKPTPGAAPGPQPAAGEASVRMLAGVGGPYLGRQFALKQGENLIGRAEGDIVLGEDGQVSRKHCLLIWTADELRVRDLGSTNGTFVGGQRVAESNLAPGDLIGIGASTFKVV